ncbi:MULTISPECIES: helix-turn-helix transcriptional regulator [Pseudomonas]|uniref:helix-turn-helix transcriptional regulator n=1 Tax=Pseudomonas TaxID=286 RepID=UPI000761E8D9|nr:MULTISPECIES: helix-turn-helix domain-containing protein [Pseudomonas]
MCKARDELAISLGFLTEDQVAMLAQVSNSTVLDWRKRGNGPPYTRFGSGYFYDISDVKTHLTSLKKERSREAILRAI